MVVNRQMTYGRDGVCKDYAFNKLRTLKAEGYPTDQLHLASVTVKGMPHMVLIVHLDHRMVVLDNRYDWTQDWPVLVSSAGYVLIDEWPAPSERPGS